MLQRLNQFLVTWDKSTFTVDHGPDSPCTWEEIRMVVAEGADLLWDMKGERKVIPLHVLDNYLRVREGRMALVQLGRDTELGKELEFTREQTFLP